jgi:2-isopropylmalate synthase
MFSCGGLVKGRFLISLNKLRRIKILRKIKIFDTTLRDGEQSPGCSMHFDEKIAIALQLEKLGVDIMEAGFAAASQGDLNSIKEISKKIKNCTVTSLARAVKSDIDAAYEAVKDAVSPRIHTFIATSPIHLEYKLKMTEDEVLQRIKDMVTYSKKYLSDIEFSAEDASRTPLPFLAKAIATAIKYGATTVNIPDTVGYSTPNEMFNIIKYLTENVEGIDKVTISSHVHDDLGLGVANSLACVLAGASQVECTVSGIGERAGNACLEEIVMGLKVRPDIYDAYTNIKTTEIYNTAKLISSIIGARIPANKAIIGANAFAHESGIHQHGVLANKSTYEIISPEDVGVPQNKIVLGKHSGKHAFESHLKEMGIDLTPDEIIKAFESFKHLCDKKKYVSRKDIESIVLHKKGGIKTGIYNLKHYEVIRIKNKYVYASIYLIKEGIEIECSSEGDGPVDAAFKAINTLIDKQIALTNFAIHSVTEGEDALGEAIVKLEFEKNTYTGKGVSTDIIEASIIAYIDGVNKLLEINE